MACQSCKIGCAGFSQSQSHMLNCQKTIRSWLKQMDRIGHNDIKILSLENHGQSGSIDGKRNWYV